jgi:uncharacterized membrane protein
MAVRARATLFGHSIHQMLVVFPMGLLITSLIFDILRGITGHGTWSHAAFWMIAAGGIGGLGAGLFGFIDWLGIPNGTRAKSLGFTHGVLNLFVIGLFLVSWLLRTPSARMETPSALAIIFSAVGVAVLLVSGWLGGELVDRLGIGVDRGAHPDAPSSLSRRGTLGEPLERRY